MKEIMDAPQLSAVEKSKLYSDELNRFLTFKNKMDVPAQASVQTTPLVPAEILPQVPPTPVPAEIRSPAPATPKPNFLTPPHSTTLHHKNPPRTAPILLLLSQHRYSYRYRIG